ncbi:hypothetical protein [Actinophytocola sp. NPDC049390]|uniref:Gp37-like protein n=1 Tax=Actinophytocola sp. NPDC049390 TaxID=3363894 RepID=UPI00379932CC
MTAPPWKVEVRTQDLQRVGELDDYQSLDLTLRFNDVSTWQLKIDRENRLAADLCQPGAGIIVSRNGVTILSGEWDEQQHHTSDDDNSLTVTGVDDTDWLRLRLAHPQPLSTAPPYSTTAEDVRTGGASSVLRQYVGVNISIDGATPTIVPRQYSGMSRGADPAYGATVTGRARWQGLLTMMQELATAGAVDGLQLGFRVVQVGDALQYQGYVPVDRTADVVFSRGRGNLSDVSYRRTRPRANYWYVGGDGEGTARTIYEYGDAASIAQWRRREGEFVDAQSAATAAELQQAALKAAADQGETSALSVTPLDLEGLQFGVHYYLGDRITAVLDTLGPGGRNIPGDSVSDVLRECKLSLTPDGYTVTPAVGSPGTTANAGGNFVPTRMFRRISQLASRVINLERR